MRWSQVHFRVAGASQERSSLTRVLFISGTVPPDPCGVGDYTLKLASSLSSTARIETAILTGSNASAMKRLSDVAIFPMLRRNWAGDSLAQKLEARCRSCAISDTGIWARLPTVRHTVSRQDSWDRDRTNMARGACTSSVAATASSAFCGFTDSCSESEFQRSCTLMASLGNTLK
jgi:hypothetical protein